MGWTWEGGSERGRGHGVDLVALANPEHNPQPMHPQRMHNDKLDYALTLLQLREHSLRPTPTPTLTLTLTLTLPLPLTLFLSPSLSLIRHLDRAASSGEINNAFRMPFRSYVYSHIVI